MVKDPSAILKTTNDFFGDTLIMDDTLVQVACQQVSSDRQQSANQMMTRRDGKPYQSKAKFTCPLYLSMYRACCMKMVYCFGLFYECHGIPHGVSFTCSEQPHQVIHPDLKRGHFKHSSRQSTQVTTDCSNSMQISICQ